MTDPTHSGDAGDKPPEQGSVGSVGEEAAKLLGALSEWARDQGVDAGSGLMEGVGALAGQAATTMSELNGHIATGATECTYCPICRTVHVVRQTSPEVRAHLASAASSFLQAMAGFVAALPPPQQSARGSEFERIDLEDDDS